MTPPSPSHDWICTYRLQLRPEFTFADAAALADYLAQLGVSHVYLSPVTTAMPGSAHGYDVADPTHLNPELGGEAGYDALCGALDRAGIGQLLDIVPNHMAASPENLWFADVLSRGEDSPYIDYFDFAYRWRGDGSFRPIELPVLGERYGVALAEGKLRVEGNVLLYGEGRYPLDLRTLEMFDRAQLNDPDVLHERLMRQPYRLVHWRKAADAVDYRRFFNINGLIGVRIEREEVFRDVHALALRLVAEGKADGLRVDHIDGLRAPTAYLERLRAAAPDAKIVVEKILALDEALPDAWPIDGTTGYEFLALTNGLFVDPSAERALTDTYAEFTGECPDYASVLASTKSKALDELFSGEHNDLVDLLCRAVEAYPAGRDWPNASLTAVVRELTVALPVYRTYVDPAQGEADAADAAIIESAYQLVKERVPDADDLVDLVRDILLGRTRGERESEFVLRWQQLTGPVMAKGAEDTAFYNYNRLISLNEVGGVPAVFGTDVATFHAHNAHVATHWPGTLLAGTTHDTKRGEDARIRINALSEMPEAWSVTVRQWSFLNEKLRTGDLPDRNVEYMLYQTLVGAWPLSEERLVEYVLKSAREAKAHTTWDAPDDAYESALRRFVTGMLTNEPFVESLSRFVEALLPNARVSSLAQTLLRLTSPGVPDIYQGSEVWQESLVDPDNRRPVDYALRRDMLAQAQTLDAPGALAGLETGLTKLWLISRALQPRRREANAFAGAYESLNATGSKAEHVVAYARGGRVLVVVPRLLHRLANDWGETALDLPAGSWRNVFSDTVIESGTQLLVDLLRDFPVALLVREGA